jgi:putative SOS response-associated peptidase YedK
MPNLYSMTKAQTAIREYYRVRYDRTGHLPLFPSIFPDQLAPIVRTGADGARELVMARWGLPSSAPIHPAPITNVPNARRRPWRGLLARNRCVVPATSFCEFADTRPSKTPVWFGLGEDRPLFGFAGLWTVWNGGIRGFKPFLVDGDHQLFGFLTKEANSIVAAIHPKAMPVILTRQEEAEQWLSAKPSDALKLQWPWPDHALRIVASGHRADG